MFVEKFYVMDPKTVDLLPNGAHLKNGMKVLIEDSLMRADLKHDDEYSRSRALENNRWCTVSHLDIDYNNVVTFIGTYHDGTKRQRKYGMSYAWFVQLDSISKEV